MLPKAFLSLTTLVGLSTYAAPSCCRPQNSFEQGHELRQCQMASAYNAPARIDVRGSWDIYCTGAYTYWQPYEENLGLCAEIRPPSSSVVKQSIADVDFQYKSGLQAGLGFFFNTDNWDLFGKYTWHSGDHCAHGRVPAGGKLLPLWGSPSFQSVDLSSARGLWHLELNVGELQLGRSYYVGTKLTFHPFIAVRSDWIHQSYTATYFGQTPEAGLTCTSAAHSWGIGPEAGIETKWLLGWGFRIEGSASFDTLYTRYRLHTHELNKLQREHRTYLRPHSDLELGLGWGDYFCNHNYHFDLLASYGFQTFWNQNMFQTHVLADAAGKEPLPNGDLFMHGLTGQIRFDF